MSAKAERSLTITLTDIIEAGNNLPDAVNVTATANGIKAVFGTGSAAGQVNLVAFRKTTIAPGSPSAAVTHDLKAIPGFSGENVAFASLVGVYHSYDSGGAAKVIVGNSGASALETTFLGGTTPSVGLPLKGIFALDSPASAAGWAVAAGSKDLKLDAGTFAGDPAVVRSYYCGRA